MNKRCLMNITCQKKTNYKTFMASLAGILLIFLSTFFYKPEIFGNQIHIDFPRAINDQYESPQGEITTISITEDGSLFLNEEFISAEKLNRLPSMINDRLEELKFNKSRKVLLRCSKHLKYGKIVEIFKILSHENIKIVGLITNDYAAPFHFFHQLKDINKKRGKI